MELALLVYGVSLLSSILVVTIGTVLISLVIGAVYWIYAYDECKDGSVERKACKLYAKRWLVLMVTSILFAVAIPSEKTAYTMVGAYAAQKVAQDPKVQQLSGKVLTIVEQKLDEIITSTAEKIKK